LRVVRTSATTFRVESESEPGKVYWVWASEEGWVCSCLGRQVQLRRGLKEKTCRHIDLVLDYLMREERLGLCGR